MKQKTGPLHMVSLLVPCSWPWSCERYVDAVYKPLSLWCFVTVVWAEKTDEKWNNQQIKPDISQTSGKLLLCRELGNNSKCLFRCSFCCLPVLHSRERVCGGCWWQELLSGTEGIPTQGVASLALLGICKVGTTEGTEKATREFVFKSGRTN